MSDEAKAPYKAKAQANSAQYKIAKGNHSKLIYLYLPLWQP